MTPTIKLHVPTLQIQTTSLETLPEPNSSTWKLVVWRRSFPFGFRPLKRDYVTSRDSISPVWLDCHLCGMLRRLYSSCDSGQSWHEITDQVDVGARSILCIFPIGKRVNIFCFMLLLRCELVVFDFQIRKVKKRCCRSPWYFGRVPGQHQDLSDKKSLFVLSNHSNRLLFHTSIAEWTVIAIPAAGDTEVIYSLQFWNLWIPLKGEISDTNTTTVRRSAAIFDFRNEGRGNPLMIRIS